MFKLSANCYQKTIQIREIVCRGMAPAGPDI